MTDDDLLQQQLYLQKLVDAGQVAHGELRREIESLLGVMDCVAVLKSARQRMQSIVEGAAHSEPVASRHTPLEPVQLERITRELDEIAGGDR